MNFMFLAANEGTVYRIINLANVVEFYPDETDPNKTWYITVTIDERLVEAA